MPFVVAAPPHRHLRARRSRARRRTSDQRGDDVGLLRLEEMVAGAVQVDGEQVDHVEAVLLPVRLPHHHHRLLGDAVRRVGRLRIPGPEVVLAERDARRLERVGADGADLDEFFHAGLAGLLHEVDPHRGVVVEEGARVRPVPADPAGVGGEVDDDVVAGHDVRAIRRPAQVEAGERGNGDVFRPCAPLHEVPDQRAAQEPGAAGDQDLLYPRTRSSLRVSRRRGGPWWRGSCGPRRGSGGPRPPGRRRP